MGKIKILKSIKEGFRNIIQNPAIFIPAFFIALLNSLTNLLLINAPEESTGAISEATLVYGAYVIIWLIILTLVSIFLTSVIIVMSYDAISQKPSIFEASKITILKYPTLFIASIICFIIAGFGTVAFILPGIFLFVKLLYYQYAILLDNEGIINSLKRSWKITDRNWWATFFIGLFFFAILVVSGILIAALRILNVSTIPGMIDFITTLVVMPWLVSSLVMAYLQLTDRAPVSSS